MVLLDNHFQAMGKLPRGNSGYFNVSKVNTGNNTITSGTTTKNNPNQFSTAPNAVSGEICWRAFHWVLWRGTITSQTSSTITYKPFASTSGGGTEHPQPGYGFFLQNSPSVCTRPGDWAYNAGTHTLTMFFGPSGGSHVVQVATIDTLVTISAQDDITFHNLFSQEQTHTLFTLLILPTLPSIIAIWGSLAFMDILPTVIHQVGASTRIISRGAIRLE
jgi:hypothetical protein